MYAPFDNLLAKIILGIIGLIFSFVLYFLYSYTYWWRRNVFYLTPKIPFGNFKKLLTGQKCTFEVTRELYQEIKRNGHKYGGLYFMHTPLFMPTDPALIKSILATDFDHFNDRGIYFNTDTDPLSANLFGLSTEPWKILRTKLTPTFTSGKIKNMFDIIHFCSSGIVEATKERLGQPIDINELSVRYTVDTIGRCAFGIECNSLKNPEDKFRKIAERVINPPMSNGIKFIMAIISPALIKLGNLSITEKAVTKFFLDIVNQNIEYRETNNIQRKDFFQLLLDIKKNDEKLRTNSKMTMTAKLVAAQAFIFFVAGFETSSMTIDLCLFELSQNLELQNKVRAEIKKVMKEHGGKLTYDGLKEMVYLECCIQETLRKYPPLGFLNRECTKNYKIPDTDVIIEKGTKVLVSISGIQSDPEYFPDPEKFDPDRFNDENKAKIVQYTNIPFGEGRHNCIGLKFGMTQTKVCLAAMLANFEFTLNAMTKLPLEYIAQSFVLSFKNGVYLNVREV